MDAKIAEPKPATVKFGVNTAASANTIPFTTKENNPRVKTVIGSEIICSNGFTKVFKTAKINPPNKADPIPPTSTPDISSEIINKIIA